MSWERGTTPGGAGECCLGGSSPVPARRGMMLRLDRSGERPDPIPTARARCDGCGQVSRMRWAALPCAAPSAAPATARS